MCGKKQRRLAPNQSRHNQSRPIILNRRSLSSSSIPRRKKTLEVPCSSRDESHIVYNHTDPEAFQSQTVPLPSHKLLIEDDWKIGDGYVSTSYLNSANNDIQQPYNLISGAQHLLQHGGTFMTSNPYLFVDQGTPIRPRSTQQLVMYNASVNSTSNQTLATLQNQNIRFLLANKGKSILPGVLCSFLHTRGNQLI